MKPSRSGRTNGWVRLVLPHVPSTSPPPSDSLWVGFRQDFVGVVLLAPRERVFPALPSLFLVHVLRQHVPVRHGRQIRTPGSTPRVKHVPVGREGQNAGISTRHAQSLLRKARRPRPCPAPSTCIATARLSLSRRAFAFFFFQVGDASSRRARHAPERCTPGRVHERAFHAVSPPFVCHTSRFVIFVLLRNASFPAQHMDPREHGLCLPKGRSARAAGDQLGMEASH